MCGAVSFSATNVPTGYGACHCEMCRRWNGSALLAVTVKGGDVQWTGEAQIRTLQSSEWAERAWCGRCGTGLWYRTTTKPRGQNDYELPIGLFDDANGFELKREIFIDDKPDSFALAGDHKVMTRAEVMAMYAPEAD